MQIKPFISNYQEVLIEDAIYTEYDLAEISDEDFAKFMLGNGGVDSYCLRCEQKSVFRISGISYGYAEESKKISKYGILTINGQCSRHGENTDRCGEKIYFCFYRNDIRLIKIGQYPAKGDLDFGGLDAIFNKELDKKARKELGTAIGLRAYGVGIGSFVYLRRIFESLIEEAHQIAKSDKDWTEDNFVKSRMSEKIELLKGHLPTRLVKNSNLYGILSLGIHELSEEVCLANFDLVQNAILMILKEKHEEKEHQILINKLNSEISKLTTN